MTRLAHAALEVLSVLACGIAVESSRAEDTGALRAVPQTAEIVVKRASRECFTGLIHASGYLVPRHSAVVMFVAPGYKIIEVRAKVGDTIKRGDVVARAAPATLSTEKGKAPPEVDLKASAAGLILQSTAFEGMLISEKTKPLFTIAVDGAIEASVDVPSVHLLELKAGQAARLTMRDGSTLDGLVRRTPAIVDAASQMGTTRVSIESAKGLEPSRFIRATIEARRSCGIGAPMAALRRTSAGTTVQIVQNDVIVDRSVKLGLANETDSEVTSGLSEGDLLVAGTGSSREGDRVKPVFSDAQDSR